MKYIGQRTVIEAVLLASVLGFSAIGVHNAYGAIESFLTKSAHSTAKLWAEAFTARGHVMDALLAGRPLSETEYDYLRAIATTGNVYKYKVFDVQGRPVYLSSPGPIGSPEVLGKHNPAAAAAIASGRVHVEVERSTGPSGEPKVQAEAYVPYLRDGRILGAVEVYVDMTQKWRLAWEEVRYTLLVFVPIALLAFLHTTYTIFLLWLQRRNEARIVHLAQHDPLTGAANRSLLALQLSEAFEGHRRSDNKVALHLVDADNFKVINDTCGHLTGDLVLQEIAGRIGRVVRSTDLVARYGGDEFAVVQTHVADLAEAEALAQRIVTEVRAIREVGGTAVNVSLSVGTALAPLHASDPVDLQKCADVALYRAKALGRDVAVMYENGMDSDLRERNLLRLRLRKAADENAFALFVQALHSAATDEVVSFECLLRLPDGKGGYISPAKFIPLLEDMGLTPFVGRWVLTEACRAATTWPEHITVAVNLSPQQFCGNFARYVREILAETGLPPERLELEITESLLLSETAVVAEQIAILKAMGVRIVMDDFGTGYSSLSYLWKFPFDKLKVDKSCFMSLGEREGVGEILRTISAMCAAMRLTVVAEGIETAEQRDFARTAGYDVLQGFLYCRPMPIGDAAAYLENAAAAARAATLKQAS